MSTKTPGVQWLDEATLRVKERDRRLTIAFGKFCLGALPALLLLQAGVQAVVIVPVAVVGMAYALIWLVRGLRMEFVTRPDGITIRHTRTTRTLAWSEIDSFIDAFIPANQGHAHWALGIKTVDGEVLVAEMTTSGKPKGRESTVQALRAVAWRHGVGALLTGDAGNNGNPTSAGWHPDPGGAPGERFFNGTMWSPVRRHPDPRAAGTFESWDPMEDATTSLELFTTEAQAARKTRSQWIAITLVVTTAACALWASENHKGGHFTLAALAFAAAAACGLRAWGRRREARALGRIVALASSPVPVLVGHEVGLVAPAFRSPAPDNGSPPTDVNAAPAVMAVVSSKRDRMAVWSMVCSIAGFLTFGLAGIVGIVLGFRARRRVRRNGGASRDLRLATAAIVIGALSVLSFLAIIVLGAADPGPTRSAPNALAHQTILRPSGYGVGLRGQGSGSGTFGASYFNSASHNAVAQMATSRLDAGPTEWAGQPWWRARHTSQR